MQWYSLPRIMTNKCSDILYQWYWQTNAVIFFTNDNDRQRQWYSLHMIMTDKSSDIFTNDNDRQMQWYSLPMIMTDKCSGILYQW